MLNDPADPMAAPVARQGAAGVAEAAVVAVCVRAVAVPDSADRADARPDQSPSRFSPCVGEASRGKQPLREYSRRFEASG